MADAEEDDDETEDGDKIVVALPSSSRVEQLQVSCLDMIVD